MKKSILFLICIVFLVSLKSIAAVSFIMKNHQASAGSYITVPVKVKDFRNIVSFQGTLQFDQTMLSFVSVQDYGVPGMNASVFGTTQTGSGKLTFSWTDGNLSDISLNDSSTVFSVKFNVLGSNGQTAALSFVNSPTLIEIIDSSFSAVAYTLVNGTVHIQNIVPVNTVTFKLDSVTGLQGSQVSVSMRSTGFDNIISAQGTIQFDPTKVTYAGIGYYGLPGMNSSNFGLSLVSSGKLTFSWFDVTLTGQNMVGNTPLFSILFNLIGNAGDQTTLSIINTPTPVEIIDSLMQQPTATIVNGRIGILGSTTQQTLRLKIDSVAGPASSQVIVPIRAWQFKKVISIQGTISFNMAVATYASAEQFGLPGLDAGSFGASQTGSGKLMFAWTDAMLNGQTIADSSVLFALRFNIIGSSGNFTTLDFVNAPTPIEFIDTSFSNMSTMLQSGRIRVIGSSTITTLNPSPLSYCAGSAITVNYTTTGTFIAGNGFILQLSDQNGSFVSPVNLDTIFSTTAIAFNSLLPSILPVGSLYRVRVIATNPAIIGATNPADITISTVPVVFLGTDTIVCADQTVLLNAGNPGASYLWSPGGQTSQSITVDSVGLGIGTHSISVQVTMNACIASDAINITFSPCSGIDEISEMYFSLSPNPAKDMISINSNGLYGNFTIGIFNMSGQQVYNGQIECSEQSNSTIDLSGIANGFYFVKITTDTKNYSLKLIID